MATNPNFDNSPNTPIYKPPKPEKEPICGSCIFYNQTNIILDNTDTLGQCRYNSPKWPEVMSYDWCGKFKPKDSKW